MAATSPTLSVPSHGSELQEGQDVKKIEKRVGGLLRWKAVQDWWSDISPFEWDLLIASTCLKVLLFPS